MRGDIKQKTKRTCIYTYGIPKWKHNGKQEESSLFKNSSRIKITNKTSR